MSIKIKITSENSGLEKGKVYNLDDTAAKVFIGKGFAKKMPADTPVTAVKMARSAPPKTGEKSDSIKIKITGDVKGLKKGEIYDLDPIAANSLIASGNAIDAEPKKGLKITADKPLGRCNLKELTAIVEKEGVDVGEATSKKDVVAAIVKHRLELEKAAINADIEGYLAGREQCDETCGFAGDDEGCTLPEGHECPITPTE